MSDEDKWAQPSSPPPPLFLGEKERDLVKQVNDAYDHNFDQLMNSNYRLAGKINKEKSLYYTYKGKEHNFLSKEVLYF